MNDMNERFVIKAVGPNGTSARWITVPKLRGIRAYGPRELAALFFSKNEAERALQELRASKDCSQIGFAVDAVNGGNGGNSPPTLAIVRESATQILAYLDRLRGEIRSMHEQLQGARELILKRIDRASTHLQDVKARRR